MSFSSNVKRELLGIEDGARHCGIAELSAILICCGEFFTYNGSTGLRIRSENYHACVKCARLIKRLFGFSAEVSVKDRGRHFFIYIGDFDAAKRVLNSTGLGVPERDGVSPLVVSGVCCRQAYIRGAFLASGSVSDPEKTYHAEFISDRLNVAETLLNIVNSFSLNAKLLRRKENYIVYLKDSEQITDLLNIMRAHRSLLALAGVRVVKGVRNNVNRKVNFEAANLSKTISASVKQFEDINFIKETRGLSFLNEQLREAAELRLTHPEASLKEIGMMPGEPVSKSGMNHRFRKISEIADYIRTDSKC